MDKIDYKWVERQWQVCLKNLLERTFFYGKPFDEICRLLDNQPYPPDVEYDYGLSTLQ
ncbi:unnamed protein product [marine sediment metagenome]|uniref:Uncharacterized protein n=1 Tax=marine sediment metagenome TaxID=412755 RepID=X1DVW6_9ZZZZ